MPTDRTLIRKEVSTYASVLLQAAAAQKAELEVYDQLELVTDAVRGNIDLRNALSDTTIEAADRVALAKEVFKGLQPVLVEVIGVMVERDDSALLPRIREEYALQAEKALGVTVVDVTTAVELDEALRKQIKDKLSSDFGTDIVLREKIDKSILGGIVMSTNGKRIDASVQRQLDTARVVLSTVPSGGER